MLCVYCVLSIQLNSRYCVSHRIIRMSDTIYIYRSEMNDYIARDVYTVRTCSDTYTHRLREWQVGNTFIMQRSERKGQSCCAKLRESGVHLHTEI